MRVLGRGTTTLEGAPAEAASGGGATDEPAAAGPSMFVPAGEVQAPEEDLRVIDASRLTVMQAVDVEQDAVAMAGGVTAFSREKERDRVRGTRERGCLRLQHGQWLLCRAWMMLRLPGGAFRHACRTLGVATPSRFLAPSHICSES